MSDVCVFTLQVSSDGVQTDGTPLSELRLAKPLRKSPERLPAVRSAPLHQGKSRREKRRRSHRAIPTVPLGPPTLGPETPGPKKEKVAENMPASRGGSSPGSFPLAALPPANTRGSHPGVHFMFFPSGERAASQPGSQDPWFHQPRPLLPGRRRCSRSSSALPRQPP